MTDQHNKKHYTNPMTEGPLLVLDAESERVSLEN